MAKKDGKMEETTEAVVTETPRAPKILVRAPQVKSYSFEQWAKLRNLPTRHLGGMRAWLGTNSGFKHPLDKWDELFKAY